MSLNVYSDEARETSLSSATAGASKPVERAAGGAGGTGVEMLPVAPPAAIVSPTAMSHNSRAKGGSDPSSVAANSVVTLWRLDSATLVMRSRASTSVAALTEVIARPLALLKRRACRAFTFTRPVFTRLPSCLCSVLRARVPARRGECGTVWWSHGPCRHPRGGLTGSCAAPWFRFPTATVPPRCLHCKTMTRKRSFQTKAEAITRHWEPGLPKHHALQAGTQVAGILTR